jgi:hypothetical protein
MLGGARERARIIGQKAQNAALIYEFVEFTSSKLSPHGQSGESLPHLEQRARVTAELTNGSREVDRARAARPPRRAIRGCLLRLRHGESEVQSAAPSSRQHRGSHYQLGYQSEEYGGENSTAKSEARDLLLRLGVAGFLWANIMAFSTILYVGYFEQIAASANRILPLLLLALTTPLVFYCAIRSCGPQPSAFSTARSAWRRFSPSAFQEAVLAILDQASIAEPAGRGKKTVPKSSYVNISSTDSVMGSKHDCLCNSLDRSSRNSR